MSPAFQFIRVRAKVYHPTVCRALGVFFCSSGLILSCKEISFTATQHAPCKRSHCWNLSIPKASQSVHP